MRLRTLESLRSGKERRDSLVTDESKRPCRIFNRDMCRWIEVPSDIEIEYDRACTNRRLQEQRKKRCSCPRAKKWMCDAMCVGCKYRTSTNSIGLDATSFDKLYSKWELRQAAATAMEDAIECADLLERVINRFREMDKDAEAIVSLWRNNEHTSDSAIARALGRPQRTFSAQMTRYRTEFRKIRGY